MISIRAVCVRIGQIALVASLACSSGALAQRTPKIGYINFPAVLDAAPQTQALMDKLRDEFAPRERDLRAMQTELQEKQETYQRDSSVMSEAERSALEREIRDGVRDLQRSNEELQEDFNIRQNEELSTLQRTLVQQVQAYVAMAGYDLVVTEAIFVSQAVNVTSDVIAALQEARDEGAEPAEDEDAN
jgi:outer membrane protein